MLDEQGRNDLAASTNRALTETSKYLKAKNERLLEEVEELQCDNARLEEANDNLKKGIYEKHLEIHSLFEFLLNTKGFMPMHVYNRMESLCQLEKP